MYFSFGHCHRDNNSLLSPELDQRSPVVPVLVCHFSTSIVLAFLQDLRGTTLSSILAM